MRKELRFDGQVAVVTGGARGIGRAVVDDLVSRGAHVVVNGMPSANPTVPSTAELVAAELRAAGHDVIAAPADVSTAEGGRSVIEAALDKWGQLDVLVANAGILRNSRFEDMTIDQWDSVIGVNLRGVFTVTQPAFAHMKQRGYGRIIFMSSLAGVCGAYAQANYAASKAALIGLAGSLTAEGREHGITVNAVLPSAADTDMAAEIDAADPVNQGRPESLIPTINADFPVSLLTKERIAPIVTYLSHPDNVVSGEMFGAHGGLFHRFWVEYGDGWLADAGQCKAEDVTEHMQDIRGSQPGREVADDVQMWSSRFLTESFSSLAR